MIGQWNTNTYELHIDEKGELDILPLDLTLALGEPDAPAGLPLRLEIGFLRGGTLFRGYYPAKLFVDIIDGTYKTLEENRKIPGNSPSQVGIIPSEEDLPLTITIHSSCFFPATGEDREIPDSLWNRMPAMRRRLRGMEEEIDSPDRLFGAVGKPLRPGETLNCFQFTTSVSYREGETLGSYLTLGTLQREEDQATVSLIDIYVARAGHPAREEPFFSDILPQLREAVKILEKEGPPDGAEYLSSRRSIRETYTPTGGSGKMILPLPLAEAWTAAQEKKRRGPR